MMNIDKSDDLLHKSNLQLPFLLGFAHSLPSNPAAEPLPLGFYTNRHKTETGSGAGLETFVLKRVLQQLSLIPHMMISLKDIKSAGICTETLQTKKEQALPVEPQTDESCTGVKEWSNSLWSPIVIIIDCSHERLPRQTKAPLR